MNEAEWLACEDPARMLAWRIDLGRQSQAGCPTYTAPSHRKLRLFACACCRAVWPSIRERSRQAVEVAERFADGLASEAERKRLADCTHTGCLMEITRDAARYGPGYAKRTGGLAKSAQAAILREITGNPFRPVVLPPGPAKTCSECGGTGECATSHKWTCYDCKGTGKIGQPCPWLTPTVVSLAQAAYDERPGRKCGPCAGLGEVGMGYGRFGTEGCRNCGGDGSMAGTGRIEDGTLDPVRLSICADALEEAGCPPSISKGIDGWGDGYRLNQQPHPLLAHLRSPGPHVRGCFAIDLILGKS